MCCLLRSLTLLMPWFWSSFLKISSKMGLSLWQHLTGRQKVKTNILPVLPKSSESQYLTKQLYLYHIVFSSKELYRLQESEILQLVPYFFLFLKKEMFSLNLTLPVSRTQCSFLHHSQNLLCFLIPSTLSKPVRGCLGTEQFRRGKILPVLNVFKDRKRSDPAQEGKWYHIPSRFLTQKLADVVHQLEGEPLTKMPFLPSYKLVWEN